MSDQASAQEGPFSEDANRRRVFKQLRRDLSTERLDSFRSREPGLNAESNPDLLEKYAHNLVVAQAFYPALHMVEILLRNRTFEAIKSHLGAAPGVAPCTQDKRTYDAHQVKLGKLSRHECTVSWLDLRKGDLTPEDREAMLKGRDRGHKRSDRFGKTFTEGRLIAALDLNFWVRLFGGNYSYGGHAGLTLWPDLLPRVFPEASAAEISDRDRVEARLERVKATRNSIFHQEPVAIESARDSYEEIMTVIRHMSPTSEAAIRRIDGFEWTIHQGTRLAMREKLDALHDCPLPIKAEVGVAPTAE